MEDYDVRSAASIMASVKEQEARFEQLTRALEEERRNVTLQLDRSALPPNTPTSQPLAWQQVVMQVPLIGCGLLPSSGQCVWDICVLACAPFDAGGLLHPQFVEFNTACSSVQCTLGGDVQAMAQHSTNNRSSRPPPHFHPHSPPPSPVWAQWKQRTKGAIVTEDLSSHWQGPGAPVLS
ncbi:hypothetical protein JOQ06_012270, partial [Pogonophryne albipinna]